MNMVAVSKQTFEVQYLDDVTSVTVGLVGSATMATIAYGRTQTAQFNPDYWLLQILA